MSSERHRHCGIIFFFKVSKRQSSPCYRKPDLLPHNRRCRTNHVSSHAYQRGQQDALGGDGVRSQCMAYGHKKVAKAETKKATDAEIKLQRRHERALAFANRTNQHPEFACRYCGRKLVARIGQLSHERACARKR